MLAEKIIIKPLVTEKTAVMESLNKYGFIVSRQATKEQIKRAVNELYGIKPIAVNMVNVQGKSVRFGRNNGRRSDYKKALVTLPIGKTITIHEGV
ncbi:MAG: 50S ribosomal protein L23 [Candidatus Magasanikbacteria bacterium CG10_big_fil_rev_8_21_14_0_10_36_32]|uniref:Large ribosomal subunit protein uL23 n=1 Tax=Candidatus Magasanikbacteria bacterium CG10_big_fil_rev_8_21_14_0_10_36_32 TaxID=1974646 RepID=A0A2M6W7H7_9BACT|nr:MAG: 50S ribosomal protein L23 [Candidatus Magasanikbacteria bacterium CG10_big_fil_rev_8_21_14_0_10_36_32]